MNPFGSWSLIEIGLVVFFVSLALVTLGLLVAGWLSG